MYLRTTNRTNRDGSVVTYYQLAHNEWDPESRQTKAKILCGLGRSDEVERQVLVRLCESIARVCDVEVVDRRAGLDRAASEAGLPADVEFVRAREVGVVHVVEALWERLGLGPRLRAIAQRGRHSVPLERALLAMVANRLGEPTSKLGVWERWLESVHLPSCASLKLAQMYEALDLLQAHQAEVEEAVFFETATLLNLDVEVVLFDTTSCSFAIDEADAPDEGLRAYGYSKEGTWTPQVVVALAVTREGFPVRSWVFPGNTADVAIVKRVRDDLRGWKLARILFVGDAGMNSEDNRMELARACGKYVLACRAASVKEVRDVVLGRPGRYSTIAEDLRVKEVVVGEGTLQRRYIVCHNPKQAQREQAHREQVVRELEEALAKHEDLDARRKWVAQLRASGRYGRYLAVNKNGTIRIDRAAVADAARYDGKWVLLTNDDSLTAEQAAHTYKGLLVIEQCFRSLKSTQIEMRPMYHWLPHRIEAHVKVCVLALLIQRVAEHTCGRPWTRIRHDLASLQVAEYTTPVHRFFQASAASAEVTAVLKALAIEPVKRIVAVESVE